ncbi:hypothetical protein [Mycobacterium sp. DBP42]|uniref:hypothetical protein n=1 Tax=Mycobacteriaceae TaxID=1762 RepID=UPI00110C8D5C|nr:hypothetical protein [Mycobacterium sp. DBP42]TMS45432.1 hypothetical protein E0T84_31115 [Mycobacterium sp. DBP42]
MWDLDGKDKSRPLSEMIDMHAYQQRLQSSQRQAERTRRRSEHRGLILSLVSLMAYLSYVIYVLAPDGFWTNLTTVINGL